MGFIWKGADLHWLHHFTANRRYKDYGNMKI